MNVMKREFLGTSDAQQIVLHPVFSGSPLVVATPFQAPSCSSVSIEGPKEHLAFLYPHLIRLVKETPFDFDSGYGIWTGVEGYQDKGVLTLYYQHGSSFPDRIQLLEHHFRRDCAFYCDLMLVEITMLSFTFKDCGP